MLWHAIDVLVAQKRYVERDTLWPTWFRVSTAAELSLPPGLLSIAMACLLTPMFDVKKAARIELYF